MAKPTIYGANALLGGADGALDSIDGAILVDKDISVSVDATQFAPHYLDAAIGGAENSPLKVVPDDNAGTKRWILKGGVFAGLALHGNVVLSAGVTRTIGHAAGPILTFDDTTDFLKISGCDIGIEDNGRFYLAGAANSNWKFSYEATPVGAVVVTAAAIVNEVFANATSGFLIKNTNDLSLLEIQGDTGNMYVTGYVGVGTITPRAVLEIVGPDATGQFLTVTRLDDTTGGVNIKLLKERATGQTVLDNDKIGALSFNFFNDAVTPEDILGCFLRGVVTDASDGTEDSYLEIQTITNGTLGLSAAFRDGKVGVGLLDPKTKLTVEGALTLKEQAAADGDTAAYGQDWVKNTAPCTRWFTDDTGIDHAISPQTLTFSTAGPTDNVDVTGISTLFLDCSGNDVTIGGFAGGVNGQVLHIARIGVGAFSAILEHAEAAGTQKIYLHAGADEELDTEYGGWVLICHGGVDWHDCSHSKHV